MVEQTTIQLRKDVLEQLKKAKEYPRQTYNDLVAHMAKVFTIAKKSDQYDRFLHKIQQTKMKELWDNEKDEAWEHA